MIFGNPDKFAVYFDEVAAWSPHPTFVEGLFGVYVNGVLYPRGELITSSKYNNFFELTNGALLHIPINHDFYCMDKIDLFRLLLKRRYPAFAFDSFAEYKDAPDDWDAYDKEEFLYEITNPCLTQAGVKIFTVSDGNECRVLLCELKTNEEGFFDLSCLSADKIKEVNMSKKEIELIGRGVLSALAVAPSIH